MATNGARRTYLKDGRREGVDVTPFRGVFICPPGRWLTPDQFRSHVTDDIMFIHFCDLFPHNIGIEYDTCDPEVPQAGNAPRIDQDVSLERMDICKYLKLRTLWNSLVGHYRARHLVNAGIRGPSRLPQAVIKGSGSS